MTEPVSVEERAAQLLEIARLTPLADSRLSDIFTPRHAKRMVNGGYWVPIFCASCGREGGFVPEQNMTFVSWLCHACEPKYGHIDGLYMEPDRIYWARVELEQLETYGRRLSDQELFTVAQADSTPLATLIKEGR